MRMMTHYKLLGVPPDADHETIRAAYRRILKESHPDLHRGDAAAEQRSKKIIDAYAVLRDSERRLDYDHWLHHGRQQRRRLLLITLLLSMAVASGGSLALLNVLLSPDRRGSPLAEVLAAQDQGSARTEAAISAETAAQPIPERVSEILRTFANFQPPLPQWADRLLIENARNPAEIPVFAQSYAEALEARLADARLAEWIDRTEDRAKLDALRRILAGPLAERAATRLAQLEAGDMVTAALPRSEASAPAPTANFSRPPEKDGLAKEAGRMSPMPPGHAVDTGEAAPSTSDALNRAIAVLNRSILDDPRNPRSYLHRAAAWLSKGNTERALVDYSAAISLDRSNSVAFHQRGLLWLRLGEVERALADLDQAIRMSFSDPLIYRDRGMIWYQKGRYDRAIADFDRAIKLAPHFAHPYFLRGLAFQRKGDAIRAAMNFKEAISRDPIFASASRD
jgi:tetratricopeptide (TPR) repeat protein